MAVPWNVAEILEEVKEIHQLMKSIDDSLKILINPTDNILKGIIIKNESEGEQENV